MEQPPRTSSTENGLGQKRKRDDDDDNEDAALAKEAKSIMVCVLCFESDADCRTPCCNQPIHGACMMRSCYHNDIKLFCSFEWKCLCCFCRERLILLPPMTIKNDPNYLRKFTNFYHTRIPFKIPKKSYFKFINQQFLTDHKRYLSLISLLEEFTPNS